MDPRRKKAASACRSSYAGDICRANPAHGTQRYTSSGGCIECAKARANARHAEIRALIDSHKAYNRGC